MAEAVVSIALGTLRDLLMEESKFLLGVSGEVKALQKLLKEIRCLLEDADRRQNESKSVANWISAIRDLAYRAEDVTETYAFHVSSKRRRRRGGVGHLLTRFSCVLNGAFSLHKIGSEMLEIKSEIARVTTNMQDYGIRSIIQGESSSAVDLIAENQNWKRQTFPFEIEDCFVGKDEELKRLVSLIVDDEQHRVVSVWGMGGIGKTTVARKVYNHVDTRRCFECFAWVCITQKCRIRSVVEDVVKQLIPQKMDDVSSLSNTELVERLLKIQKGKRCMIVVDDIWEIDHWDGLKQAFLAEGLNVKILITTRKLNVANKVGFPFEIGLLNAEDGWKLLKRKAFQHTKISDIAIEEKLQEIGEQMVCKCGYLPLVISVIGGVLSKRKSTKEWEIVNRNINAYLLKGEGIEDENEIYEVLNFSYEDLPYCLKPCLLYMGQFREDETINVYTLYRLWISQGIISHENRQKEETLMETAELYLNELASRSMVEVLDYISEEKYRSCRLHDVVRELCLLRGKKEDFGLSVMDYQGGKFSTLLHESLLDTKTRHLAIYFHDEPDAEPDHGEYKSTYDETGKVLRSLQFLNHEHVEKIEFPGSTVDLQRFKLLRVLFFDGLKFAGRKLPRGIGSLIHLRYLYLRKCELDELPSSIGNLTYLHTLDLSNSWNVRVPNFMKKMCRLRHLLLPSYDMKKIENYRLRLEGLEELETLYGFNSLVHDLKSCTGMKNLRRLAAVVHDNASLSGIMNAIALKWKKLHYCGLIIKQGCQLTSTEEGLMVLKKVFQCPILHDLGISVCIGNLLEECRDQMIASRLVSLYLFECGMEDDPMEILGKLPVLEEMCLNERCFMGEEMNCHALDFPSLKSLAVKGLPNLRKWRVEEGAMPLLSQVEIERCSSLEMVPDGFRFIATLRVLKIIGMHELGKRVFDGGEDYEKIRHVPSIVIEGD